MSKELEQTELEKAKELVLSDMKERAQKAGEEIKEVLERLNCALEIGENGITINPKI